MDQAVIAELAALGWKWDEPAQEWRRNDTGEGFDAVAATPKQAMAWTKGDPQ